MPIRTLNHAVLYVRDTERSKTFYTEVLGFRVVMEMPGQAVFLQAPGSTNDHDLGLFAVGAAAGASGAGRSTVGLYHLCWEVETLNDIEHYFGTLAAAGVPHGGSDHGSAKSIYAEDPDGLEFEIAWLVPADLLDDSSATGPAKPLDLEAEKARYGADTRGGVGISLPV